MATVMIVDDNPDIIELFTIFLTNAGYSVISALGGNECIEVLRTNHPDLILLDIMMQPVDGWHTLTKIKEMEGMKDVPVVILTGKVLTEREEQDYGGMFALHMMKPITPEHLVDAITARLKS